MKKHEVKIEDLQNFKTEGKMIFASSSKEPKQLYCTLRGSYEVWYKHERVLETKRNTLNAHFHLLNHLIYLSIHYTLFSIPLLSF